MNPFQLRCRKRHSLRRIKHKRLKETIYLLHFLTMKGIKPDWIISGKDDGKEPDFTIVVDGKYIGIELTTLPRLRERMGNNHLLLKKLYWSVLQKLSLGHTKQYDPHHLCLKSYQYHFYNQPSFTNKTNQHNNLLTNYQSFYNSPINSHQTATNTYLKQPNQLLKSTQNQSSFTEPQYLIRFFKTSLYKVLNSCKFLSLPVISTSHTLINQQALLFTNHSNQLQVFKQPIQQSIKRQPLTNTSYQYHSVSKQPVIWNYSFSETSAYVKSILTLMTHHLFKMMEYDETNKPASVITQIDIDAVMQKKSEKVPAYKTRRKLDELWLLIHTNEQQPKGILSMPNKHLFHHSDFDNVWLTIYPTNQLYEIKKNHLQSQLIQKFSNRHVSHKTKKAFKLSKKTA